MTLGDFRRATADLSDDTPMEVWMAGEDLPDHLTFFLDGLDVRADGVDIVVFAEEAASD